MSLKSQIRFHWEEKKEPPPGIKLEGIRSWFFWLVGLDFIGVRFGFMIIGHDLLRE